MAFAIMLPHVFLANTTMFAIDAIRTRMYGQARDRIIDFRWLADVIEMDELKLFAILHNFCTNGK